MSYEDSDRDEDWSDDFDDRDSDDWEEHYSITERDEVELENDMYDYEDDEEAYYSEDDSDDIYEEDEDGEKTRLESVVEWLEKSDLIKPFRNNRGFFVHKGQLVRLEDEEVVELVEWLLDEGVADSKKVGRYEITYVNSPNTCELLVFVKTCRIVDVPFSRNNNEDLEVPYDSHDDEIPF